MEEFFRKVFLANQFLESQTASENFAINFFEAYQNRFTNLIHLPVAIGLPFFSLRCRTTFKGYFFLDGIELQA